jgi:hypothetical protein
MEWNLRDNPIVLDFLVSSSQQKTTNQMQMQMQMQIKLSNPPTSEFPAVPKFNLTLANQEFTVTKFTPNVMDLLKLVPSQFEVSQKVCHSVSHFGECQGHGTCDSMPSSQHGLPN